MRLDRLVVESHEMRAVGHAFLGLFAYLAVTVAARLTVGGVPGDWSFAGALALAFAVALWTLRVRHDDWHPPLSPVSEAAVILAATGVAALTLIDAAPLYRGAYAQLPAGVAAAVLIAAGEECLIRGSLLTALARPFGRGLAVLLSAIVFGGLHGQAGLGVGLTAFFAGLALAGLRLRAGLVAAVVFHATFNVLTGPIFGMPLGGEPWPGLLAPAVPREPLAFWPVQLAFILLALWWAPLRVRRGETTLAAES